MSRVDRRPPATRRELRRSLKDAGRRRQPAEKVVVPGAVAYALVLLALAAVAGELIGFTLLSGARLLGLAAVLAGAMCAAAFWLLVRRRTAGYWFAVGVLGLIGVGLLGYAATVRSVALAVVVGVPPLLVTAGLLQPSARAELLAKPPSDADATRLTGEARQPARPPRRRR